MGELVVDGEGQRQQLDRLLKSNRGNIDASLQSLNAVLGLLSHNKQALERINSP